MNYYPLIRKIILICGDAVCLYLATTAAMLLELGIKQSDKIAFHMQFLPILIIIMLVMFNVYGLFSLVRKRIADIFLNIIVAVINIYVIAMAVTFFFRSFDYSLVVMLYSGAFSLILLFIWNYICLQWEIKNLPEFRGILFCGENEAARLQEKIGKIYGMHKAIKEVVADINGNQNWQRCADKYDLIFIGTELDISAKEQIICYGRSAKKQMFIVPTMYEMACKNTSLIIADDIPMQRITRLLLTAEQKILKRMLDIAVSIPAIIILLPLMALTAVAIKADSKGPVIYSQERVGQYGKTFKVYKFRSMKQDAEAQSGPVLAKEGDSRITKVGRFIRATRIDELPQLFNVLKGEMSIVGPRPERPFFVEQFIKEKPEYAYRHNGKPGITGLAQIAGKYNTTAYDKLIYDLIYIQEVSVKTDLIIMLQTLKVLITKESTEGVK